MTFQATVVNVLLAAPGDTDAARVAVLEEVARWNGRYAEGRGFVFSPWSYVLHATPLLGDRPQAIINRQGVDKSDVVVAVFGTRVGTPTGVDVSGTVEEINRAVELGKPVHVYFLNGNVNLSDVDPDELQRLTEFKTSLQDKGLYAEYATPQDLARQVRDALEYDLDGMEAAPVPTRTSGARLTVDHEHEKETSGFNKSGQPKYRHTVRHLVVANVGDRTAEGIELTVRPLDESRKPIHFKRDDAEPFDLTPGSRRSWTCFPMQGATDVQVDLAWREGTDEHTASYTTTIS
ncbi:hypothetical protein [Nostocoides australiense]